MYILKTMLNIISDITEAIIKGVFMAAPTILFISSVAYLAYKAS